MARPTIPILFAPRKPEDRKKKKNATFLRHLQQNDSKPFPVQFSTTPAYSHLPAFFPRGGNWTIKLSSGVSKNKILLST